jgi:hypothetical protein
MPPKDLGLGPGILSSIIYIALKRKRKIYVNKTVLAYGEEKKKYGEVLDKLFTAYGCVHTKLAYVCLTTVQRHSVVSQMGKVILFFRDRHLQESKNYEYPFQFHV